MRLIAGDTLRTPAGARVGAVLFDGTRLALGEKTELVIDKYLFSPAESQYGLTLRLLNGVLAYISGRIAALAPQSSVIQTPVGIIGTRGTALAIKLEPAVP